MSELQNLHQVPQIPGQCVWAPGQFTDGGGAGILQLEEREETEAKGGSSASPPSVWALL